MDTAGRARPDPALWAGCRGLFSVRVDLAAACLPAWAPLEGPALGPSLDLTAEGAVPAPRALRLVRVAVTRA